MAIWKRHWHYTVRFSTHQPLLSLQTTRTTTNKQTNKPTSAQKVQVQPYEHQNIVMKTQRTRVLRRYQEADNFYLASHMKFHSMLQMCSPHHIIKTKNQITQTRILLEKLLLTTAVLSPVGRGMESHGSKWGDRRGSGKLMGFEA